MSRTVAAVDCGTNSIRLLVLERHGDGQVDEVTRQTRLARLGQGVDATGEFHPDALERTFAVLDEYAGLITEHGVDDVRFVATSAARDVSNRDVFEAGVRDRLGVGVDVISGDEEARLSSNGVLSGVSSPRPTLIFDIGGGSTELVVVGSDERIASAISLDIGAVRIKERFLPTEPPTADEAAAARAFINAQLDASGTDFASVASSIGVAGTVTSVAAEHLNLAAYSRDAVHGTVLTLEAIDEANLRWLTQTTEQIAANPLLPPLRAAVIGAGSMILAEIVRRLPSRQIIVSESDILDGIAQELLDR